MKKTMVCALLAGVTLLGLSSAHAADGASCAPAGGLNFICGMKNPEDLALIPKTHWLIASGMEPGSGLQLIDTEKKTAQKLFSASFKLNQDKAMYGVCPGPLDVNKASFHGLALRPTQNGRYKLLATQHGERESVEVFEVQTSGGTPSLTWVGCVPMPNGLAANSAAAFSDGSILATVLMFPGKTFGDSIAKRNTGAVFLWKPGSNGFEQLAGTELPGNNGIDVSPDDQEFYVVSSGLQQVVAFSRANPSKPARRAQFKEFTPDNVHWTSDGKLISAGMIDNEPGCGGPPKPNEKGAVPNLATCPRGYIAVTIDPKTMQVTEVARGPATPAFSAATIAVPVAGDLWIGSFHADRVAYRPAK